LKWGKAQVVMRGAEEYCMEKAHQREQAVSARMKVKNGEEATQ
jgi:hypothetical protein